MFELETKTIYALATPPGRGGISIVRLSGPQCLEIACRLTGLSFEQILPRQMTFCSIYQRPPGGGSKNETPLIDQSCLVFFRTPHSFTGEDVVEFHLHGSPLVVQLLCETLASFPGTAPAGPGEFSKRAFLHGKMDITSAEGIADLIAADTRAQQQHALSYVTGKVKDLYQQWREQLLEIYAQMEASIEFAQEDREIMIFFQNMHGKIKSLKEDIQKFANQKEQGERIKEGITAVLVGAPNVGKSTILNGIAKEEVAIVSSTAGTTRDPIRILCNIGGFAVHVVDTAGLRTLKADEKKMPTGQIEWQGQRKTKKLQKTADIKIFVMTPAELFSPLPWKPTIHDIIILNKADQLKKKEWKEKAASLQEQWGKNLVFLCAKKGLGFEDLVACLQKKIYRFFEQKDSHGFFPSHERHVQHLQQAIHCLTSAEHHLREENVELAAEDIRLTSEELSCIVGSKITTEDFLGSIFKNFCIGK